MYEIWLGMNIVYEIALAAWPVLAVLLLAWIAMLAWAARRPGASGRAGAGPALVVGAAVAVLATLALPALTRSSLSEATYWVDWMLLGALGLGAGAAAALLCWPLLAGLRSRA